MKMDNITATVYINYVRGTHSPIHNTIASAMWKWLDSHLTAEYLPEVENLVVDKESKELKDQCN